jgi:hypothetical protein
MIDAFFYEAIPILRGKMFVIPETQAFGGQLNIPISYSYPENHTSFAFTSVPIYTKYC